MKAESPSAKALSFSETLLEQENKQDMSHILAVYEWLGALV